MCINVSMPSPSSSRTRRDKFVYLYMAMNFGAWAMQNTVKATVDSLRLPTFQTFEMRCLRPETNKPPSPPSSPTWTPSSPRWKQRRDKTRDLKQAMMQELLTGKTRLVPAGAAHA